MLYLVHDVLLLNVDKAVIYLHKDKQSCSQKVLSSYNISLY